MTSFFDKLKKGMGIDEPISEPEEEEKKEEIKKKPAKKPKKERKPKKESKTPEIKIEEIEIEEEKTEEPDKEEPKEEKKKKWPSFSGMEEGELAIDVYQTNKDLIIQSAIAGVDLEDLDISIEGDIIN